MALDLDKIKSRAKEGAHYSKWLYVWELIEEFEKLQKENEELKNEKTLSCGCTAGTYCGCLHHG